MRHTFLLAVALLAVAALPASAEPASYAGTYAGGILSPGAAPGDAASSRSMAVAAVADGEILKARIAFGVHCSRVVLNADQLVVRARIAADGSFAATRSVRSRELGRAQISLEGSLAGRQISVRVQSTGADSGTCDTKRRAFALRSIDDTDPDVTGGIPIGYLAGVTSQRNAIPFPFVARTSQDGRRIERSFIAFTDDGVDVEGNVDNLVIRDNAFSRTDPTHHGRHTLRGTIGRTGLIGRLIFVNGAVAANLRVRAHPV